MSLHLILKKQRELDALQARWPREGREPSRCLHMACPSCKGTGQKKNPPGACIHMISCPCPSCTPYTL